jgi:hypothetical protein
MIHILSDSCSDLSPDLRARYHIDTIPLYITLDGKSYRDGDLTFKELFDSVKATGQLPKTAAPSVVDFEQFFSSHPEISFSSASDQKYLQHIRQPAWQQNKCRSAISELLIQTTFQLELACWYLAAADLRDQGYRSRRNCCLY